LEITIVGAGPVGCYTAELLAKAGHQVLVLEEHPQVGVPEHCTGIVSERLINMVPTKSVLNRISTADFFGKKARFSVDGTAYVIDRKKFDQERYEAAKKAGAEFLFNTRVGFDGETLMHENHTLPSDMIIAADGSRSSIRSYYHPYRDVLPAAQYLVQGSFNSSRTEIHLWPQYTNPGLFTWIVPQSKKVAKVGVACSDPKACLEKFIKEKLPDVKIKQKLAGTVMVGGPIRQDYGRVMLVGDAAGHVKATTGGGLVPGLMCAEKLVESIETGKRYSRLSRRILNQLRYAVIARGMWDRMSPNTKEIILQTLSKNVKYLKQSDMDWHSLTLISIVGKELPLLPRILFDLIF
jgi:digeranylgeranylglycerophospholipid reductase